MPRRKILIADLLCGAGGTPKTQNPAYATKGVIR